MKISYLLLCGIVLFTLGSLQKSEGAGFILPNQDAFATAKGNAYVATAEGPSAVFYNPAGLTQISQKTWQIGTYSILLQNEASIGGKRFEADREWQFVPHFYYAQPIKENLYFGLGMYAPFGLGTEWGQNTPFRTFTTKAQVTYISLSPVLAYKITDQLSVGAGLALNYGDIDLRQGIGIAPGDEFRLEGDDVGVAGVFSLFWHPHPQHAFGALYRTHANHTFEGDAISTPFSPRESASADATLPDWFTIGYSYRPNEKWNIELDIQWVGWNRLDTLEVKKPSGDLTVPFFWKDALIYQVGFTYAMDNGYHFGVGYNYNESAQPDEFFNPAVADADRHWINLGLGKKGEKWSWNIAYQFGYSDRTVSNALPNAAGESVNGEYEARHHAVIFSIDYKF